MAHTASCAKATTRSCRCGGCAGTLHGWTGALALARPGSGETGAPYHQAVDQEWQTRAKPGRSRRPYRRMARQTAAAAEADIIGWLANSVTDPGAAPAEFIASVGDAISAAVFDALPAALGHGNNRTTRAGLAANHLFCSCLAECARAMQQLQDELDQAIEQITDDLLAYCIGRRQITIPDPVAKAVAAAAARTVSKLAGHLPVTRHVNDLLQAVRVLAVLACPAPENHEAVIRYALTPLGEPIISDVGLGDMTRAR